MQLVNIIHSLSPLGNPAVSINEKGIHLEYQHSSELQAVFSSLESKSESLCIDSPTSLIIPHLALSAFLKNMGVNSAESSDAIEVYYLENNVDRAERLAHESTQLSADKAYPLSEDVLHIEDVAMGPRPNQLLAKLCIQLPKAIKTLSNESEQVPPPRVTFMLDRSGSMREEKRLNMLKPAVINALDKLSPETLVSIYFYDDTFDILFENKPVSAITQTDLDAILSIQPRNGTRVRSVIKPVVDNMRNQGLLANPMAFENLTLVWLTDGEDETVNCAAEMVSLFEQEGCMAMPQLIAVGMGNYNHNLLNGVAEDVRFKSNLMLHIDSPEKTAELFDFVSRCVGVMRQRVVLMMHVDGTKVYQDLGIMQAGHKKTVILECPCSNQSTITCGVLINDDVYRRSVELPTNLNQQNMDLLCEYFTQLSTKVVLAERNNPTAAKQMQDYALASIPPSIQNVRLRELRELFMPKIQNRRAIAGMEMFGMFSYDSSHSNGNTNGVDYQRLYSDSLRSSSNY